MLLFASYLSIDAYYLYLAHELPDGVSFADYTYSGTTILTYASSCAYMLIYRLTGIHAA